MFANIINGPDGMALVVIIIIAILSFTYWLYGVYIEHQKAKEFLKENPDNKKILDKLFIEPKIYDHISGFPLFNLLNSNGEISGGHGGRIICYKDNVHFGKLKNGEKPYVLVYEAVFKSKFLKTLYLHKMVEAYI